MSDEANSRADAKLKRLPVEIHCEIVQRLDAPNATQLDVLAWLKKYHGLESSPAAFSRALPFIRQRVKSFHREQGVLAWMQEEKELHPEISDEELFRRGQRKFSLMAVADEDPDVWVKIQRAQRDKEATSLDRQKFQRESVKLFIEWAQNEEAMRIANSNAPTADKTERLGQKLFGELWQ